MLNKIKNIVNYFLDKLIKDKIFRNSIIISGFLVFGQLLSIYRERVLVQYIGLGTQLDIYNAAFKIPDLVFAILLGFVATSTMIPYLSKYVESDIPEYRKKFNSSIFSFTFMMTIISLIVIIFMDPITRLYAGSNFIESDYNNLVFISKILMLQPLLLGLSLILSSLGQIKDNFYTYSLAPILYTFVNILGVIFMYNDYGLKGVIYFVLLGALLHLSLQIRHLRSSDIKLSLRYFCFDSVKEHLSIAIPRSSSYTASQVFNIIITYFTLSIGPSVLSAYILARKVFDVPIQIILTGISNSSIPTLSKLYTKQSYQDFKKLYKTNLRNIMLFSIVSFFIVITFSQSLLKLFYGDIENITLINYILKWGSFAIILSAFNWYATIFFSVIKKIFIVSRINIFSVILLFILSINIDKNINNLIFLLLLYSISNSFLLFVFFWKEYKKML